MPKTHDRDVFYKYVRPEDGIRILDQLAIDWPSPLLFNNPFDNWRFASATPSPNSPTRSSQRSCAGFSPMMHYLKGCFRPSRLRFGWLEGSDTLLTNVRSLQPRGRLS